MTHNIRKTLEIFLLLCVLFISLYIIFTSPFLVDESESRNSVERGAIGSKLPFKSKK